MKIGILCAGDSELAPFLPMIDRRKVSEKAMLQIHEGTIEGIPVAALYSGVCKVNAAVAAQILIDSFGCGCIINSGTAGGMDESLRIFDTVVSTEAAYHDVAGDILTEFHPWLNSIWFRSDEKLIQLAEKAAGHRVFFGKTVTGEQFIADENRAAINEKFAPLTADMETAAIAHVCHLNRIPFIAVRTVTDTAEQSGIDTSKQNCEKASAVAAQIVREMLKDSPQNLT